MKQAPDQLRVQFMVFKKIVKGTIGTEFHHYSWHGDQVIKELDFSSIFAEINSANVRVIDFQEELLALV